ncbi:hypothetical protein ACFWEJ_28215, partial [Promicromonospora sp. NPDC060204]
APTGAGPSSFPATGPAGYRAARLPGLRCLLGREARDLADGVGDGAEVLAQDPVVVAGDLRADPEVRVALQRGAEAVGFYSRPGLVWVPVRDAPRCQWAFVWRTADPNPLIRAFAAAADDAADALADRPA